jgi:hypothetical protein
MMNEMQLRMVNIEPFGMLPAGNEMNLPHPRRKFFNASEPVFQEAVFTEARFGKFIGVVVDLSCVGGKILFPLGIVHVDPGNDEVDSCHGAIVGELYFFILLQSCGRVFKTVVCP